MAALCAGYGGLELAVRDVWPCAELAWVSEIEPHAARVLDARFGVPNLGDLTAIDAPPRVDVVTAGFPCQPFSHAGLRKGTDDHRWLIDDVCRVARDAGAHTLILENVVGLLSGNDGDALARVCQAMAASGFRRWQWTTLRASDVGACHRRDRWFCVANTGSVGRGERPGPGTSEPSRIRGHGSSDHGRTTTADTEGERLEERRIPEGQGDRDVSDAAGRGRFGPYQPKGEMSDGRDQDVPSMWSDVQPKEVQRQARGSHSVHGAPNVRAGVREHQGAAGQERPASPGQDAPSGQMLGLWGDGQSARSPQGSHPQQQRSSQPANPVRVLPSQAALARGSRCPHGCGEAWAHYGPAVERWCQIIGRCAPFGLIDGKLNPRAVEWMMGLEDGWVTDIIDSRAKALHCLGNGVVPQQAAAAIRELT